MKGSNDMKDRFGIKTWKDGKVWFIIDNVKRTCVKTKDYAEAMECCLFCNRYPEDALSEDSVTVQRTGKFFKWAPYDDFVSLLRKEYK